MPAIWRKRGGINLASLHPRPGCRLLQRSRIANIALCSMTYSCKVTALASTTRRLSSHIFGFWEGMLVVLDECK